MKKKVAIIGAGISGLIFANLLKENLEIDFTLYEKNSSLNLSEGYGLQLSTNSVSILNKIGFADLKLDKKFNPKKIDFYSLKNNSKICDLDISQFNSKNISYTTLKRSFLIEFLKDKLFSNSIQFNKKIEKINCINSKVEITFEKNTIEIFDYLIIADGIFSSTKSILFKKNIKPKQFGSLAFRTVIKKEDLKFINEKNISLFLGPNIHLTAYPINIKNEINLITIIRKNLDFRILNDGSFFSQIDNIRKILEESSVRKNDDLKNLFNNVKEIKCFPTFTSDKISQTKEKNIFFLGDALYAFLPTFAQGASQSIESAYELFKALKEDNENSFRKYYDNRLKRITMINRRSKLNYFIFHISNPILVCFRNIVLKIVVKNKSFLNRYLGAIYLKS